MRYEFTDGPLKAMGITSSRIADVIEVPEGEYRLTDASKDTARYEWIRMRPRFRAARLRAAREVRGQDEGDTAR